MSTALSVPRNRRLHGALRGILSRYPLRFGAAWFNRKLDRVFGAGPNWALAPGRGAWPLMVLNLATSLQRKYFYFPTVYGRFYGRTTFNEFLVHKLAAGATFLDIGANVGFFALLAARLVGPSGRVYAFEPEPDICEALQRSASANGFDHLHALQLALSNHDGELTFYRARDGTASSLVPEAPGHEARYERTLSTRVSTLDAIVAEQQIDPARISLLKVDVEGEEPRTILGMLGTLRAAGYPSIWCEVRGPKGSSRAPNTYGPVRDTLATLGYQPFHWSRGTRRPLVDAEVVNRIDVLFERA